MKACAKNRENQVDTKPEYFQRFAPFSLTKEGNTNMTRLIAASYVKKYRGRNSLFLGASRDKTDPVAAITEMHPQR